MKAMLIGATTLIGLSAGCATDAVVGDPVKATAPLESRSGSTVVGMARFTSTGSLVTLKLNVSGAAPGMHGVHLHLTGDCSAPDAASAGAHWNPSMVTHGLPSATPHHVGDCGNLDVGADGTGALTLTGAWTIGTGMPDDIVGKAVIVHANVDDGTMPAPPAAPGNAGARQACGVIVM